MRRRVALLLRRAAAQVERGRDWPMYFVRVATKYSEACKIVHTAREDGPDWTDQAVARVRDFLLEDQGVDISLFAVRTRDRFDPDHALAVIAASIATDTFDGPARQEYLDKLDKQASNPKRPKELNDQLGRKIVSFVFPRQLLGGTFVRLSPANNLNFAPADHLHHDAHPPDVDALARALLEGIRANSVLCTFLGSAEYRTQAAVALSWSVERFGDLTAKPPAHAWRDGRDLTAEEQLSRLRLVAGDRGFQSRPEFNR